MRQLEHYTGRIDVGALLVAHIMRSNDLNMIDIKEDVLLSAATNQRFGTFTDERVRADIDDLVSKAGGQAAQQGSADSGQS